MTPYQTVKHYAEAEITEKKSRFIATVSPVQNDEEARAFVDSVKKKYPDARHNVYAYLTVDGMTRYSDDGEPKGTAGLPVLNVIMKKELKGAAVVVTRYFGGILLGAPGLLRAYTAAATAGIEAAETVTVKSYDVIEITVPFSISEKVRYELSFFDLPEYKTEYTEKVKYILNVPSETAEKLTAKITDVTSGKAEIKTVKP